MLTLHVYRAQEQRERSHEGKDPPDRDPYKFYRSSEPAEFRSRVVVATARRGNGSGAVGASVRDWSRWSVRYPRPLQIGARRPFARPGTLRTPAHWCTNGAPFTHRRVSALPPARTHCTASSAHRPCTQLTRLGEPELASAASVASRPLPNGAPIAPPCT